MFFFNSGNKQLKWIKTKKTPKMPLANPKPLWGSKTTKGNTHRRANTIKSRLERGTRAPTTISAEDHEKSHHKDDNFPAMIKRSIKRALRNKSHYSLRQGPTSTGSAARTATKSATRPLASTTTNAHYSPPRHPRRLCSQYDQCLTWGGPRIRVRHGLGYNNS